MRAMRIDRLSASRPTDKMRPRSRRRRRRCERTRKEMFVDTMQDLREVVLLDGRTVRIRPIERSDLELERRFVMGLSPRTRYLRLLSGRCLQPGELERWTDIDPAREIALVAVATTADGVQQVGVVRCARDELAPPAWDFGIVVADAWQGVRLGDALLARLVERAEARGVPALGSVTLAENRPMVALARRLGFSVRREPGDATLLRLERELVPAVAASRFALPWRAAPAPARAGR
jgi:acetyltransferase